MMNKLILLGNVGKDPEVKTFDNGNKIATFSIATSYKYKKGEEWHDGTEWTDVKVLYSKKAEAVEKYVKKGTKLLVEGTLRTESWEKDGETKYRTFCYLENFEFAQSKSDNQEVQTKPEAVKEEADDDLPF